MKFDIPNEFLSHLLAATAVWHGRMNTNLRLEEMKPAKPDTRSSFLTSEERLERAHREVRSSFDLYATIRDQMGALGMRTE